MTEKDHQLTKLAEECCEVGQRCTKALRFGTEEIQDGQPADNAVRIEMEFAGVLAAYETLIDAGVLDWPNRVFVDQAKIKQKEYLEYSRKVGRVISP